MFAFVVHIRGKKKHAWLSGFQAFQAQGVVFQPLMTLYHDPDTTISPRSATTGQPTDLKQNI